MPEVGKTAEEYTWAEIKAISEAGKGDEYFNLGDTKSFTTTDGIEVMMEIVAFNADTKADGTGTAGITWVSKSIVARHFINLDVTKAGGGKECEMRTWLQNDFYNTIPENITNIIESVDKTYWDYETETTLVYIDNVWIPSYRELLGSSTYEDSGATYSSYYSQFPSYKKYHNGKESYWWMRSARRDDLRGFNQISNMGYISSVYTKSSSIGVVPGFCT